MDPQMSVERSLDAWEEVQRHGQDLADRLAQGFSGILHSQFGPAPFTWPSPQKKGPLDPVFAPSTAAAGDGVAAILDIGSRLGRAGAEFGASLNGVAEQFFRQLPPPFFRDEKSSSLGRIGTGDPDSRRRDEALERRGGGKEEFGAIGEEFGGRGFLEATAVMGDELEDEEGFDLDLRPSGHFGRHQGSINITSTYDSRTNGIETALVARGDLWRAEATHGGSASRNENSPLFLVQLGPVLFVRDATLLLPVHLSKQHLLWYGYDRKNGMHSLCPAIWSKHRRWLVMSMICLNPFTCSYMDLQFPNGQLTYVAGDGLTASAFLPVLGGLLQAQGQYPGDTRFSFSCKNKMGTRVTPMVHWPDKSISLDIVQPLVWKRSGLMLQPTIQFSVCPTFGGSDPGLRAEFIHSVKEKLCLTCGCSCTTHPSAFATVSLGRSKWNGNVGRCGIVLRVETPLSNLGRPTVSIQLNSGIEF